MGLFDANQSTIDFYRRMGAIQGAYDEAYEKARGRIRTNPRLLEMDVEGNITYKRNIKILLGQPNTQHALLIKFAINNPNSNGIITFEELNIFFQANKLEKIDAPTAIRQRFKNAISEVFRRYPIDKTNPDGKKLFEPIRGVGYKFNNPILQ